MCVYFIYIFQTRRRLLLLYSSASRHLYHPSEQIDVMLGNGQRHLFMIYCACVSSWCVCFVCLSGAVAYSNVYYCIRWMKDDTPYTFIFYTILILCTYIENRFENSKKNNNFTIVTPKAQIREHVQQEMYYGVQF